MAKKQKQSEEKRVNLDADPTVRAFQFLRSWAKKNGEQVCNAKGVQIQTASDIKKGGAWDDDYSLIQLNRDIAADEVTPFVNGGVIVYRINPNPRPYNRTLASA